MSAAGEARIRETVFAAIDFETTGALPGGIDEPVQVGIAQMGGIEVLPETFVRKFIRSEHSITPVAHRVHHISERQLDGQPPFLEMWPLLQENLSGKILVAHNARVEQKHLRVFPSSGFGPWVDTLKLSRRSFPQLAKHSLSAMIEFLMLRGELASLCPGLGDHDALYDAAACLLVLREVILTHGWEDSPVSMLGVVHKR